MAESKKPGTHHVVPNSGGGWDVRRGGAERASGHFDTKRDAVSESVPSAWVTASTARACDMRPGFFT